MKIVKEEMCWRKQNNKVYVYTEKIKLKIYLHKLHIISVSILLRVSSASLTA